MCPPPHMQCRVLEGGATSPPPYACLTVCSAPPPAANYAPLQERLMWDGLVAVYEAGLVEAVGVSNYGPRQLQRIAAYLAKRGVPLASVQVQYSLLSRGPDQEAVRAACADLGVALIAYSPLALGQFNAVWSVGWRAGCCALEPDGDRMMSAARQGSYEPAPLPPPPGPPPYSAPGMLTGKYEPGGALPSGPRGLVFRRVLPGLAPLLGVMREIGERRGKTPSQIAINWCIAKGTIPIPGAKDLRQAKDNLGALGWRLR